MPFEDDFMAIYDAMTGIDNSEVPWVPNVWSEDTAFTQGYELLHQLRESLAQRLGLEEAAEDAELENILGAVMGIQEDACRRMFYCTIRYILKGCKL